jgi:hypothetical protein
LKVSFYNTNNQISAKLAGIVAITLAEKVEQLFTHWSDSYVPAHILEALLKLPDDIAIAKFSSKGGFS